jgi:hemoglobin
VIAKIQAMKDITNKAEIENLIEIFYGKVFQNEILAPFFKGLDFKAHKPQMVHFWSFVLISEPGYKTNVTEKHLHMPLKAEHFEIWIKLFKATIDELFVGETAEMAKQRADLVGWTILEKIKAKQNSN